MKIGMIGAGNMGGALLRAIAAADGNELYVFDADASKATALAKETKATVSLSAEALSTECDAVFLAVKPNIIESVIKDIRKSLKKSTLLVSMAAGVKIERLTEYVGFDLPIIRIMPNTPVAVMSGMIVYTENSQVTNDMLFSFQEILKSAGRLDRLPESLIDAETAVAGCGPAFAYMFIDALAKAGCECGLESEKALLYAAETVKGAAEMVLLGSESPSELTRKVCSPGGSTIEGVKVLEDKDLYGVVKSAVIASFEKTKKLGK